MTYTPMLKFSTYDFPAGFSVASNPSNSILEVTQRPYADGAIVGTPLLSEKIITIRGTLFATTASDMRTQMDALLAAVNSGRQKLYLWDDRYIYATKRSFSTNYDPSSFDRYCDVAIDFVCDVGLFEAETVSTDTWATPANNATRSITNAGGAFAMPTFAITFTGTSGVVGLAIGSDSFVFSATVTAGSTLIVDCAAKTVLIGTTDKMSGFTGVFPSLALGANTLTRTGTSAITSIVTTWRNRWY